MEIETRLSEDDGKFYADVYDRFGEVVYTTGPHTFVEDAYDAARYWVESSS